MSKLIPSGALLLALAMSTPLAAKDAPAPASLWHGGPILTMDGNRPQTVRAVVERGGRIVYAGAEAQARRIAGTDAADHDLKGATMLPGFVDAHSHFAMAMQVASGVDLGDPDAPVRDVAGVIAALKAGIAARGIQPGGWVVAWNYDEGKLAEKRHLTAADEGQLEALQ